jgi:hypothetical protein
MAPQAATPTATIRQLPRSRPSPLGRCTVREGIKRSPAVNVSPWSSADPVRPRAASSLGRTARAPVRRVDLGYSRSVGEDRVTATILEATAAAFIGLFIGLGVLVFTGDPNNGMIAGGIAGVAFSLMSVFHDSGARREH